MNEPAESVASPVTRVRIGVATHVTPKSSLTDNDALQGLMLVIDECIEAGEFKIIIDFASVQTIDSLAISAFMDLQDRMMKMSTSAVVLACLNIHRIHGRIDDYPLK